MSSNAATATGAAITASLGVVTTTAVSIAAGVNAIGNFAQAANIKSTAWLQEVQEDTEDLAVMRRGLRDQRIASKIANEAHSIEQSIQDPGVKKLYDAALKQLQASRAAAEKAAKSQ